MNNARRRQIDRVRREVLPPAMESLASALSDLEGIEEEEQGAFDNMPEGLQAGEKGEMSQEAISKLEDAINTLNEFLDSDICDVLGEAAQ